MIKIVRFKGQELEVDAILGKGKSGYSYLVNYFGSKVVAKVIHHEPCSYYQFDDKFKTELRAYKVLREINVPIPDLIDYDEKTEIILKEYFPGDVAIELVAKKLITDELFENLYRISEVARQNMINLDYFPANFVVDSGQLRYIDYEFNSYENEWNLENWGIFYWLNNSGVKEFLRSDNHLKININATSGKPITAGLEEKAQNLFKRFR